MWALSVKFPIVTVEYIEAFNIVVNMIKSESCCLLIANLLWKRQSETK